MVIYLPQTKKPSQPLMLLLVMVHGPLLRLSGKLTVTIKIQTHLSQTVVLFKCDCFFVEKPVATADKLA